MVAYAGTRRSHDRHDAATLEDLRVDPGELGLPAGVEVRWLGVAGFAITCEGTTVLIDPYASRVGLRALAGRSPLVADRVAIDRWIPRADAVLVGHTHFDHALDVPAIARRDRAPVYGSASAARLLHVNGLGHLAVAVEPHRTYGIGPFEVTFVPSVHSKLLLGRSVPNGGEVTCEHVGDLTPDAYGCGQVWGIHLAVAGATLYHQGSADLLDDEVRHRGVDVFLCGVAGRQVTDRYLPRMLPRLDPATVVVTHHDDFLRPLDRPQGLAFGVDVARFPDEVAAVSRDARVVALPPPVPVG
jgi:L-ascorbate metabolism protein UlaG (beta-lactamase superfamily)